MFPYCLWASLFASFNWISLLCHCNIRLVGPGVRWGAIQYNQQYKSLNNKYYTWKAAAHTLHTDIIVKSFYILWLFTTNKGAHWKKIETSTIMQLAVRRKIYLLLNFRLTFHSDRNDRFCLCFRLHQKFSLNLYFCTFFSAYQAIHV